jgi:hypothetical protein
MPAVRRQQRVRKLDVEAAPSVRPSWPAVVIASLVVLAGGLLAGRFLGRGRSEAASLPAPPLPANRIVDGGPGPWGQLRYARIGIQPRDEQMGAEQDFGRARWFFGRQSRDRVAALLHNVDLPPAILSALMNRAAWEETPGGTLIDPPEETLLGLEPAARARLYEALAPFAENQQRFPVPLRPELLNERLETSSLTDGTLKLFRRLLYPKDSWLLFSDTPFVLSHIPELKERARFLSTLARNMTYLVTLHVDVRSDIEGLARYWGFDGRAKDLTPLLQSLARLPGGSDLDLAHLLPPLARRRVFTYPTAVPGQRDVRNCFWTAMNFFNETPDDRLAEAEEMVRVLSTEYERVDNPAFGDVVFITGDDHAPMHAASYLADQLVFTKNGSLPFHPWMYMKVSELIDLYSVMSPVRQELSVSYYRRKRAAQ